MTDLVDMTIAGAGRQLEKRAISAEELLSAILLRIDQTEHLIHAFSWIAREQALNDARLADKELNNGQRRSPLHGIPIGVKDLLFTAGMPTEAGSRVLKGHVPTFDATVITKLRGAGAIIVGKTVTHEFAYGMNIPETRNPWQLDCYPGGSSAGSGAAVAARSVFGALGTDTGGSIRAPAAVNGIVGLKPTYGRVSRFGCIPLSPSLDHVGPLTRTVEDCALLLQQIAGYDSADPASLNVPVPNFSAKLHDTMKGKRIGIDAAYFLSGTVQRPVLAAVEDAADLLFSNGAVRVDVRVPELEWSQIVGDVTVSVDASAWHRNWMRTKSGDYHRNTRLMLELGALIPATDYDLVQRIRSRIRQAVKNTFLNHRLDALLGPMLPIVAPPIAELPVDFVDRLAGGPLSAMSPYEYPANVTGLPALSVPCGLSETGLPIGLQLIGRPLDEPTLMQIGNCYQAITTWHDLKPPLPPKYAPSAERRETLDS